MNLDEFVQVTYRSFISLSVLFVITKLLGKKQVSQLSLFDYTIGISIGNFAAEITTSLDTPFEVGLLSMIIFGLVAFAVSILTMKSMILRRFFIGEPTVLIQNGNIIEKNLRKVKMDVNDLLEQCRINNYFDVNEIEYGLLEANGVLSILPKGENKNVTVKDMNISAQKQGLCSNVIIDTQIMEENLKNINKDIKWLKHELKVKGYKDTKNILLATVDINDKLNIYEKNVNIKINNVLE